MRWRLHPCPEVASRYVVVEVYATVKDLRAALRRGGSPVVTRSGRVNRRAAFRWATGACTWNPRKRPVATVVLAAEELGAGYVAHEFLHATMCYASRCVIRGDVRVTDLHGGPIGERLAEFHETLTKTFWRRWYDHQSLLALRAVR